MIFHARDRWPIWLWSFALFLGGSLAVAVQVAIGDRPALIILVLLFVGILFAAILTPLDISADSEWLHVGKAKVEINFISVAAPLKADEMRALRGPEMNPDAFLALRFWVKRGVKISIDDPKDPTPYWLVSVKRAEKLAAILTDR